MKKSFILLTSLSILLVSPLLSNIATPVKADETLEGFNISHGTNDNKYKVLVGEVVELLQSEFIFTPFDYSNQQVEYSLFEGSFSGTLPPAMFTDTSTNESILIKGLMVGDFAFKIAPVANPIFAVIVNFSCVSELESQERPGLAVIKTQEDNDVKPGATSIYEKRETIENKTPLFVDDKFSFRALIQYISSIIDIKFFIIVGGTIVGLGFLYLLIYVIKKIAWKSRR